MVKKVLELICKKRPGDTNILDFIGVIIGCIIAPYVIDMFDCRGFYVIFAIVIIISRWIFHIMSELIYKFILAKQDIKE